VGRISVCCLHTYRAGSAIVRHPEGIAALRFTMKAIREPDDAPAKMLGGWSAALEREGRCGVADFCWWVRLRLR
jgi:hypothetical protein